MLYAEFQRELNVFHLGMRLYHNKMWKKWSALNTFQMCCNDHGKIWVKVWDLFSGPCLTAVCFSESMVQEWDRRTPPNNDQFVQIAPVRTIGKYQTIINLPAFVTVKYQPWQQTCNISDESLVKPNTKKTYKIDGTSPICIDEPCITFSRSSERAWWALGSEE